jgi:endoglucanase
MAGMARTMRRFLATRAGRHGVLGLLALSSLAGCGIEGAAVGDEAVRVAPGPVERCVNLSNALEAPREGVWGYRVRRADLERIAAAGFDTVRLPVKWSAHADRAPPYKIDPAFLARVDEVVDWALAEGLQVIVDVHHYDALFEAPDTHMPRLEAIWRQLARHYRDAPDAVILELLNEPRGALDITRVDRLNHRLLEIIRAQDPDRWVVLATGN